MSALSFVLSLLVHYLHPPMLHRSSVSLRNIELQWTDKAMPQGFTSVGQQDLEEREGQTQQYTFAFAPITPRYVKIVVNSGYGPFAAVKSASL